jgi:GxxExxY protein
MNPNRHLLRNDLMDRDLVYRVVNAFYQVYNTLGFGFLESTYSRALQIALTARGIRVDREVTIQVFFEGQPVGLHRIDMLVERRIIIEIKSSEQLSKVALRQVRSYLAAANLELGLVLHFGAQPKFCRVLARKRPFRHPGDSDDAPNSDA